MSSKIFPRNSPEIFQNIFFWNSDHVSSRIPSESLSNNSKDSCRCYFKDLSYNFSRISFRNLSKNAFKNPLNVFKINPKKFFSAISAGYCFTNNTPGTSSSNFPKQKIFQGYPHSPKNTFKYFEECFLRFILLFVFHNKYLLLFYPSIPSRFSLKFTPQSSYLEVLQKHAPVSLQGIPS